MISYAHTVTKLFYKIVEQLFIYSEWINYSDETNTLQLHMIHNGNYISVVHRVIIYTFMGNEATILLLKKIDVV